MQHCHFQPPVEGRAWLLSSTHGTDRCKRLAGHCPPCICTGPCQHEKHPVCTQHYDFLAGVVEAHILDADFLLDEEFPPNLYTGIHASNRYLAGWQE